MDLDFGLLVIWCVLFKIENFIYGLYINIFFNFKYSKCFKWQQVEVAGVSHIPYDRCEIFQRSDRYLRVNVKLWNMQFFNRLLMHLRLIWFNSFVSVSSRHSVMGIFFLLFNFENWATEPCGMQQHGSVGFLLTYLWKHTTMDLHTINVAWVRE